MVVISSHYSDAKNREAVVFHLRRQGVESPEEYLEGAEFIFVGRGLAGRAPDVVSAYDLVLRIPARRKIPFDVSLAVRNAIWEAAGEQLIWSVQFMAYDDPIGDLTRTYARMLTEEPEGINNCFFKQQSTITHDELRFRSRGEIAIYEELKQRDVLIFPNAAAVLGTSQAEYGKKVEKREPDFLICYKGKWGILEINGDDFHTGVVQTAKDHARARKFKHYGVLCIEAYPLERCRTEASNVVDEFLTLLDKHK